MLPLRLLDLLGALLALACASAVLVSAWTWFVAPWLGLASPPALAFFTVFWSLFAVRVALSSSLRLFRLHEEEGAIEASSERFAELRGTVLRGLLGRPMAIGIVWVGLYLVRLLEGILR